MPKCKNRTHANFRFNLSESAKFRGVFSIAQKCPSVRHFFNPENRINAIFYFEPPKRPSKPVSQLKTTLKPSKSSSKPQTHFRAFKISFKVSSKPQTQFRAIKISFKARSKPQTWFRASKIRFKDRSEPQTQFQASKISFKATNYTLNAQNHSESSAEWL